MRKSHTEKVRVFLVNWLFTSLYGMALDEWLGLLRRHRFSVDPPYLPRAAFMTLSGALTSLIRTYENRKYVARLTETEIKEPLFILGHWRSGTSYLHNLISLDEQFAHPTV